MCPALEVTREGVWTEHASLPRVPVLLPGSFNPVHEGHWRLAEAAGRLLGRPVAFELSLANVDKPDLTDAEVRRRLEPFMNRATVWITRAPTFRRKAELFPGAVFVVGADTAARIVAVRYYGACPASLREALALVRQLGCSFLVGGRLADGRFLRVADLAIPAEFADLFAEIPPEEFRLDVSSTQLRREAAGEHERQADPSR